MNRQKFLPILILTLVMLMPLAGCAPPPAAPAGAPAASEPVAAPAEEKAPVKIVYWRSLTGVSGDSQDELVRRFNESQDDVEVEVQFQGAYAELVQKLLAALAAGDVPDLVLLDSPFVVLFAKDGVLVPLNDFATDPEKGRDLDDFVPGLLQDGYYKDKLYALPMMRSTPLLYYNRDMFKELGLPDRVPDTWDEFQEFSEKLTVVENGDPVRWGVAFTMGRTSAHWYLQGAIYSYGGEVSDEDFNILLESPEAVAAAQLWHDMVFEYKTAIPGLAEGGSHADFLNERVGMVFGSTGSMKNLMSKATFEVGAGFMPQKVRHMVPVGGSVIAMTSTDPERQAATWEFMNYMTGADSNVYVVQQTGYMPTSKSAQEHPDMIAYFEEFPERKVGVEQLEYARPQASVISLGKGTEILRVAIESLLVAGTPAPDVMKAAADELRAEYEETFE